MARREINIFGTSFLDLLSGALAAVIILFVIVPKMTSEQQNALEEIERLNVQVEELENLMVQIQNSVPQDIYEEIQQRMNELQNVISELTQQVENLQERLASAENENQALREEVARLRENQEQSGQLRRENERLKQQVQELEERLRQAENEQNRNGISDGKVFGMNAKIGIVCIWPENVDVDLYVKNLTTGQVCYFGQKSTPFGNLMEDVRSRTSPDDDRYELFYQRTIVPGNYQIYVNIYGGENSTWNGQEANVDGYVVMNPGKPNQIKIPYRHIVLTQKGVNTIIGTLTITETNISLQQ